MFLSHLLQFELIIFWEPEFAQNVFAKMVTSHRGRQHSIFQRYTALKVLAEVMIDEDIAEEKLYNDSDEDFEEEEDRVNAHHPLLVNNVLRSLGDSENDSGDIGDNDYVPK